MFKKLFFILLPLLSLHGAAWGATYYVTPTGSGTTCSDAAPCANVSAVFSNKDLAPEDIVEIRADTVGGEATYRETLTPGTDDDGDSSNYITVRARSGDTIIFSGSTVDDGTGWSDQGGNVWRKNIGAVNPGIVWFNTSQRGVVDATPDSAYEFTYTNPNLDVYAESNPATFYTKIEYPVRNYAVLSQNGDYIKWQNLIFEKAATAVATVYDTASNSWYDGCTVRYNNSTGLRPDGAAPKVTNCTIFSGGILLQSNATSAGVFTGNTISVGSTGIYLTSNGHTVSGNTIYSITSSGIQAHDSDGNTISNNTIYSAHNGLAYGAGGIGNGIYLTASSESNLLSKNILYDNYNGIHIAITSGAGGNLIRHNTVYNSIVNSIFQYAGSGTAADEIHSNTIISNPGGAYNSGNNGHALSIQGGALLGVWANNLCHIAAGTGLHVIDSGVMSLKEDHNLVYVSGGIFGSFKTSNKTALIDWQTATQADAEITNLDGNSATASANDVSADPLFISLAGNNFGLQPNSPAIDAGTAIPSLHTGSTIVGGDAAGNTKICFGGIDIGAYEFCAASISGGTMSGATIN